MPSLINVILHKKMVGCCGAIIDNGSYVLIFHWKKKIEKTKIHKNNSRRPFFKGIATWSMFTNFLQIKFHNI